MESEETTGDISIGNEYLRIRLEELQDHLMYVAVHMHGVLSAFLEAGFSVDHAFTMAQATYLRVLDDMQI